MVNKEKRTKLYMQKERHKKRLERMAKVECKRYPAGVILVDERYVGDNKYEPLEKPFAIRANKSKNATRYKYFKKYSNKLIRRKNRALVKGSSYKKEFDYKWTVD